MLCASLHTNHETDETHYKRLAMGDSWNLPNCWVDVWVKAVFHKSPNNTRLPNAGVLQRQNKTMFTKHSRKQ